MGDIRALRELCSVAFDLITSNKLLALDDGRYDLGNGVYVNIESYITQFRSARMFESHRKYVDIQYMICGEELIAVAPAKNLIVLIPYDEEKDITFYNNEAKSEDYPLKAGDFLILRPEQAHMPCVCLNGEQHVRKAVFKVPI